MAKNHDSFGFFITPKAEVKFASLTKPSQFGDSDVPVWDVQVFIEKDATLVFQGKTITFEDLVGQMVVFQNSKTGRTDTLPGTIKVADCGRYIFKAKKKREAPVLLDAGKNPLSASFVGGGSVVRLKVGAMYQEKGGPKMNGGLSFYLQAAQVLELKMNSSNDFKVESEFVDNLPSTISAPEEDDGSSVDFSAMPEL